MLQIKRETDYAIRCLYYLSGKEDEVVMVDEIAQKMRIPKTFLAKILQRLAKAGLVQSYVGVKGGFYLAKKPQEINLYEVITTIEGPVAMNKCTVNKNSCSLSRTCTVHPIWVAVRGEIEELLKKNTFKKIREAQIR